MKGHRLSLKFPDNDIKKGLGVQTAIAKDQLENARHEIDVRDNLRARTRGLNTETQNIVVDMGQNFAEAVSRDFGISAREAIERTGIRLESESAALGEARLNAAGELVDSSGRVLFQKEAVKSHFEPTPQTKNIFIGDLRAAERADGNPLIRVGHLSRVYEKLGIPTGMVKTNRQVILKDTIEKHNVPLSVAESLPSLFSDPLLVFESATQPGRYVSVIDAKDGSGNQIVVALAPDKTGTGYHFIPSFYGKDNLSRFVEDNVRNGRLKYMKNPEVSDTLQLRPQALREVNIKSIIQQADIVKRFYQDEQSARGYFDWTKKSEQIIKILQGGDIDTIVHELGHLIDDDKVETLVADFALSLGIKKSISAFEQVCAFPAGFETDISFVLY
jgi:hypothetical protein